VIMMSWNEAFKRLDPVEQEAVKKMWRIQKQIVRDSERSRKNRRFQVLVSIDVSETKKCKL